MAIGRGPGRLSINISRNIIYILFFIASTAPAESVSRHTDIATPRPFTDPKVCLQSTPNSRPRGIIAYRLIAPPLRLGEQASGALHSLGVKPMIPAYCLTKIATEQGAIASLKMLPARHRKALRRECGNEGIDYVGYSTGTNSRSESELVQMGRKARNESTCSQDL